MKTFYTLALIFASMTIFQVASANLSCQGADNAKIGWWAAIKYPRKVSEERYAYIDMDSHSEFDLKSGTVDQDNGPIDNTFKTINEIGVKNLDMVVFNDQPLKGEAPFWGEEFYGHAKGILAFDQNSQSGLYLMHSAPKFPTVSDSGIDHTLPDNAHQFGQTFICVSISSQDQFNNILSNIEIIYANTIYAAGSLKGKNWKNDGESKIIDFGTNGGSFTMITKSPKYEHFLYDEIMSQHFQETLLVESWGRPYQAPTCNGENQTLNIKTVKFSNGDEWKDTMDHSKWAITESGHIGCICDINKMETQLKKGGSCMCAPELGSALKGVVGSTDECNNGFMVEVN